MASPSAICAGVYLLFSAATSAAGSVAAGSAAADFVALVAVAVVFLAHCVNTTDDAHIRLRTSSFFICLDFVGMPKIVNFWRPFPNCLCWGVKSGVSACEARKLCCPAVLHMFFFVLPQKRTKKAALISNINDFSMVSMRASPFEKSRSHTRLG